MLLATDAVTRLSFRMDSDYLPRLRPIARALAQRVCSDEGQADEMVERILQACAAAVSRTNGSGGKIAHLTLRVTRDTIDADIVPVDGFGSGCVEVLSMLRNGTELQRLVCNRRETHAQTPR